jgi:hypothetical protein
MIKSLCLITMILFLAGCASPAQSPDTNKGPLDSVKTPTVTPSSGPILQTPDQGGAVIILEQSGGIAGISKKWTIYADGRVLSDNQAEFTLAASRVDTTLADIRKLGFFEMQADYSIGSKCMDCFLYTVTVNSNGSSKTVAGVAGDAGTPAKFMDVIGEINSLISP